MLIIMGKTLKRKELSLVSYPLFWFLAMLLVASSIIEPNVNKVKASFFLWFFWQWQGCICL